MVSKTRAEVGSSKSNSISKSRSIFLRTLCSSIFFLDCNRFVNSSINLKNVNNLICLSTNKFVNK